MGDGEEKGRYFLYSLSPLFFLLFIFFYLEELRETFFSFFLFGFFSSFHLFFREGERGGYGLGLSARGSLEFIPDANAVKDRSEVRIREKGKRGIGKNSVEGWKV